MLNTVTFVALVAMAEAWVVWLAYSLGFNNGWLDGMDRRRRAENRPK